MKKIWVHVAKSFEEAEQFEREYYSKMSHSQRLEEVQQLRERYFKIKPRVKNAHRKGLRRVIRIIKQK